eukprot:3905015-Amphidinium_carterae.1
MDVTMVFTHRKKFASPKPSLEPEQQQDDCTTPALFAAVVGKCVNVQREERCSPIREFMPRPSTVEPPALDQ